MTEQTSNNAAFHRFAVHVEAKWREQIHHDVIIIACIQRDILAARLSNGANHIQRLIAVERRDFDGDDILNFGKPAPEGVRENAPADCRLQVKSNQRNNFRNALAMRDEFRVRCFLECGQTQQPGVEPEFSDEFGFC